MHDISYLSPDRIGQAAYCVFFREIHGLLTRMVGKVVPQEDVIT